jgi:serine/threonine protein kinase
MNRSYTFSVDYYSLGCLLYELVTLNNPFKGKGGNINFVNQANVYLLLFFLIICFSLFVGQI